MPAKLQDFLQEFGGEVDSSGAFTLDAKKARQKMKRFQLADPHEYACHFLAAAVLAQASQVAVHCDADDLIFECDGQTLGRVELEQVFSSLLAGFENDQTRLLRELAIGLNAALGFSPAYIHLDSGGHRLALTEGSEKLSQEPREGGGFRIHVRQRASWRTLVRFYKKFEGLLPEAASLVERSVWAPVQLRVNQQAREAPESLGQQLVGLRWYHPDHQLTLPQLEAPVVLEQAPPGPYTGLLLLGPSRGCDLVLDGLTYSVKLDLPMKAIVGCRLPKNVSQSELVESPALESLKSHLKEAFQGMVRALGQAFEDLTLTQKGSARQSLWNALFLDPELASIRFLETPWGTPLSWEEVKEYQARHGRILYSEKTWDCPPLDPLPVLKVNREQKRDLLGLTLEEADHLYQEAVTAALNQAAWRERPERLPATQVPCIGKVPILEGKGELGLAVRQEFAEDETVVEFLKDRRYLGRRSYQLGLAGLVATVEPEKVTPNRLWDGVDDGCLSISQVGGGLRRGLKELCQVLDSKGPLGDPARERRRTNFLVQCRAEGIGFPEGPIFPLVQGGYATFEQLDPLVVTHSGLPVCTTEFSVPPLDFPLVLVDHGNRRALVRIFGHLRSFLAEARLAESSKQARRRFLATPVREVKAEGADPVLALSDPPGEIGLTSVRFPAQVTLYREQRLVETLTCPQLPDGLVAAINDDELELSDDWKRVVRGPKLNRLLERLGAAVGPLYRLSPDHYRGLLDKSRLEDHPWLGEELRFDTVTGGSRTLAEVMTEETVAYLDRGKSWPADYPVLSLTLEDRALLEGLGCVLRSAENVYQRYLNRQKFLTSPPAAVEIPEGLYRMSLTNGEAVINGQGRPSLVVTVLLEERLLCRWTLPFPLSVVAWTEVGEDSVRDDFREVSDPSGLHLRVEVEVQQGVLTAPLEQRPDLLESLVMLISDGRRFSDPASLRELQDRPLFPLNGGGRATLRGLLTHSKEQGRLYYLTTPQPVAPEGPVLLLPQASVSTFRRLFSGLVDAAPLVLELRKKKELLSRPVVPLELPPEDYQARHQTSLIRMGLILEEKAALEVTVLYRGRELTHWSLACPLPVRAVVEVGDQILNSDLSDLRFTSLVKKQLRVAVDELLLSYVGQEREPDERLWDYLGSLFGTVPRLRELGPWSKLPLLRLAGGGRWSLEEARARVRQDQPLVYVLDDALVEPDDPPLLLLSEPALRFLNRLFGLGRLKDFGPRLQARQEFWRRPVVKRPELGRPDAFYKLERKEGVVGIWERGVSVSQAIVYHQGRLLVRRHFSFPILVHLAVESEELRPDPQMMDIEEPQRAEELFAAWALQAVVSMASEFPDWEPDRAERGRRLVATVLAAEPATLTNKVRTSNPHLRTLARVPLIPLLGGSLVSLRDLFKIRKENQTLDYLADDPEVEPEPGEQVLLLSSFWLSFVAGLAPKSLRDVRQQFTQRVRAQKLLADRPGNDFELPSREYLAVHKTDTMLVGLLDQQIGVSRLVITSRHRRVCLLELFLEPLVAEATVERPEIQLDEQLNLVRDKAIERLETKVARVAEELVFDLCRGSELPTYYLGQLMAHSQTPQRLQRRLEDVPLFQDWQGKPLSARQVRSGPRHEGRLVYLEAVPEAASGLLESFSYSRVPVLEPHQRRWLGEEEFHSLRGEFEARQRLLQEPAGEPLDPTGLQLAPLSGVEGQMMLLMEEESWLEFRWKGRSLGRFSWSGDSVPSASVVELDQAEAPKHLKTWRERLESQALRRAEREIQADGDYSRWLGRRLLDFDKVPSRLQNWFENEPLFKGRGRRYSLVQMKQAGGRLLCLTPEARLGRSLQSQAEAVLEDLEVVYLTPAQMGRFDFEDGLGRWRQLAQGAINRAQASPLPNSWQDGFPDRTILVQLEIQPPWSGRLALATGPSLVRVGVEDRLVETMEIHPELGLIGWLSGDLQADSEWSGLESESRRAVEMLLRVKARQLLVLFLDQFPEPESPLFEVGRDLVLRSFDWTRPENGKNPKLARARQLRLIPLTEGRLASLETLFSQWTEHQRLVYAEPDETPRALHDLVMVVEPDLRKALERLFETKLVHWSQIPPPKPEEAVLEALRAEFQLLDDRGDFGLNKQVLDRIHFGPTPSGTFCDCDELLEPVLNPDHPVVSRLAVSDEFHPADLYLVMSGLYSVINRADPDLYDRQERAFHAHILETLVGNGA